MKSSGWGKATYTYLEVCCIFLLENQLALASTGSESPPDRCELLCL
jgi:hypothetical protein